MSLQNDLIKRAKANKKTIVFPEAGFSDRIVQAGEILANDNVVNVVFVGNENDFAGKLSSNALKNITILNPQNYENFDILVKKVVEQRKNKGITAEEAANLLLNPIYFGATLAACNYVDGMVCGAEVSTADTLRPALQIIKSKSGLVSSYFMFIGKNNVTDNVFLMGDYAVVEDPSAEQLCQIAELMLEQNSKFNLLEPRVAFLSYSTNGSAKSDKVEKIKQAYCCFAQKHPNIYAVGEVQFDASIKESVAKTKMPNVTFDGPANIFVMPDINAGNIGYKLVQYFSGVEAIGPITMGFNKPVNDLSRGCTVKDIIMVTAITAIQCGE